MKKLLLLLFIGSLATASSAEAQVTPFVRLGGNYSRYAMSNFNANAPTFDAAIENLKIPDLSGGFGFDGVLGLELSNRYLIGLGYTTMTGRVDGSNASSCRTFEIPGNAMYFTGDMVFARNDKALASVGFGLGKISSKSTWTLTTLGQLPDVTDLKGDAGFGDLHVTGVRYVGPQIGAFGTLGYHRGRINKLATKDGLIPVWTASLTKVEYDFSGPYLSAGIAFNLRK